MTAHPRSALFTSTLLVAAMTVATVIAVTFAAVERPSVLRVAAVVAPHAELLRRLGGERVDVQTVVAAGESPASFDPTPRRLTALATVRLLFRTGVPLENVLIPSLARSFPDLEVIDLRADVADLLPAHDHDHGLTSTAAPAVDTAAPEDGPAAAQEQGESDPHIWLSPRALAHQVGTMAAALARLDPPGAAVFAARRDSIQSELAALDRELTALLAPVRGERFLVFHPAFGYFARDYGLIQIAIEEGGLAPSPRHLARVLAQARAGGIRAVFVSPQFSNDAAARVAQDLDVELVELDPLAPDVVANLRRIARAVLDALRPAGLNR